MKKILVPTDFSKLSDHAVHFAAHLAKQLQAEVAVIHFVDVPIGDTTLHLTGEAQTDHFTEDSLYSAQLFRANHKKLDEISQVFSSDGIMVTGQQLGGGFLGGIEHYIEQKGADLVVIGTSGEESIQEMITGNHTEQLIEHLSIPVLSLQHEVDKNIKDVVLGLDLANEKYTMKAFEMLKTITKSLDARLHIVNIIRKEMSPSDMVDLNKIAKIVGLKNYTVDVITSKDENKALMDYGEKMLAGLIVTLSDARSGLYRFFQHSFSTRLTKTSSIPVLTVNMRHLKGERIG